MALLDPLATARPSGVQRTEDKRQDRRLEPPTISLPKGGGALRQIGETFRTDPSRGTAAMSVPVLISPGRSGDTPELQLAYDTGAGAGPFGLGWSASLPAITLRTDRGVPTYGRVRPPNAAHAEDADIFVLAGAEDLVPALDADGRPVVTWRTQAGRRYRVTRYRPRVEGLFARIERWRDPQSGDAYWRTISRDNVISLYGATPESRIADPDDPLRIFSWLICETRHPKGHLTAFDYKAEDSAGVDETAPAERRRTAKARTANRYLKRIRYGNRVSTLVDPDAAASGFMFELVFDYGEHDDLRPTPAEARPWPARGDPISSRRAGFEIRTYRLCRRILMFHHFPDAPDVGEDCLVAATELRYAESGPGGHALLSEVVHARFRRKGDGYLRGALPSLEFEYSAPSRAWTVRDAPRETLENLPSGLAAAPGWVDLDGEGLAGILVQDGPAWRYKRNLGGGVLGPLETVSERPSTAQLGRGRQQLLDLDGDGVTELVDFGRPLAGYHERDDHLRWTGFKPFEDLPNIDWQDANLRFLDLDGDGLADVLITGDDALTWFRAEGRRGFSEGGREALPRDEDDGPRLVFSDPAQSIFTADMTGDGLTDLVRVTHGEVCYWPSLGHGRFGRKVTMGAAPWLASPEAFDPRRVRLGDVDGSGPADLIYLDMDAPRLFLNRQGDSWAPGVHLPSLPPLDDLSTVTVVDLLGSGGACLVWSSLDPADLGRQLRFVDLMPAGKPYLLTATRNNLGAETRVTYAPSTRFYLDDRAAGRPWATRLPFPVHVVERVETFDHVSGSLFVSRYAYHEGYFDGPEREFRGFGLVERWDTDAYEQFAAPRRDWAAATNLDASSHTPPVLTRTWFHLGRVDGRAGDLPDARDGAGKRTRPLLRAAVIPQDLDAAEGREAARALKGALLREEVYALDGSDAAQRPFRVSERGWAVRGLQGRGPNRHAVFQMLPRETLDLLYERSQRPGDRRGADPRVSHTAVLETDPFGNPLSTVALAYGRRFDDPSPLLAAADRDRQKRSLVTLTLNSYTRPIDRLDANLTPLPAEAWGFEILGAVPTTIQTFEDLVMLVGSAAAQPEVQPGAADEVAPTAARRRLIGRSLSLYANDDLSGPLPLGQTGGLGLVFETYELAITDALVGEVYGQRLGDAADRILAQDGGYVRIPGTPAWWVPSGRVTYTDGSEDEPGSEAAAARAQFFQPRRFHDPFGSVTRIAYDPHDLLVLQTTDALGNKVTAGEVSPDGAVVPALDYRVLQPSRVTDINGNRTAVAFDTLGAAAGVAVMGKPGEAVGDTLDGFDPDLDETQIDALLADPKGHAEALLAGASTRAVQDMFAFVRHGRRPGAPPAVMVSLAREIHASDAAAGQPAPVRVSLAYFDGLGRQVQAKVEAEPGPLDPASGDAPVADRWTTTGWTVFDNKGRPVRRFEPFFDDTHRFRANHRVGVSSVPFYDPLGRICGVLRPDRAFEKVRFDPWCEEAWDVNDTCRISDPRTDPDVGAHFRRLGESEFLPTWYEARASGALGAVAQRSAAKAAVHADTPPRKFVDPLGRAILTVAHNRAMVAGAWVEEYAQNRPRHDIRGNVLQLTDALGRLASQARFDLLDRRLTEQTLDGEGVCVLSDVRNAPIRSWDARGSQFRTEYDALHRPVRTFVRTGDGPEILFKVVEFGDDPDGAESLGDTKARNLRGKPLRVRDAAGETLNRAYDFKGNLLEATRRFCREYKAPPDWAGTVELEDEIFISQSRYDALNRVVQLTAPHPHGQPCSAIRPLHNTAGLLERVCVWLDLAAPPDRLLDPSTATFEAVTGIDYQADGQKTSIAYGNGALARHVFDPATHRLVRKTTTRGGAGDVLQDLAYDFDPIGNPTHISDSAQADIYFRNAVVSASSDYVHDAFYRLVSATGREHVAHGASPQPDDPFDRHLNGGPSDGRRLARYEERYAYDLAGNVLSVAHLSGDGASAWTRRYAYEDPSRLCEGARSNRLSATYIGDRPRELYQHDAHGNLTSMPSLERIDWDFQDRLAATARQRVTAGAPETTYYVYDSAGARVRKVTETASPQDGAPRRVSERLYLGGFEIWRAYASDGETVTKARETLHISDGTRALALAETRTQGDDPGPQRLVRYQLTDHLGSVAVELDGDAAIISREEFSPFGSTTYQATRSDVETPKRYRFAGKERDEESGLSYYGARYYAAWLGRWTSLDPSRQDGPNGYVYARNSPVRLGDPTGAYSWEAFNEDVGRVNKAVQIVTGPMMGPIPAIANYGASKATEAIVGKTQAAPGAPAQSLSTPDRVQAANDALIAFSPGAPLAIPINNASKAIGNAIKDSIKGDKRGVDIGAQALRQGDPTGTVPKIFQAAEDLDRAEAASNSGDTGAAARGYIDASLSYLDLVSTVTQLVVGGRIGKAGGGKSPPPTETGAPPAPPPPPAPPALGPGKRLPIVDPHFTPTITPEQAFQGATDRIVNRFGQDPALVGNYMSPREMSALLDAHNYAAQWGEMADLNRLGGTNFGKAVERAMGRSTAGSGLLQPTGQMRGPNGRFIASPDFAGIGPYAGSMFDTTTLADLPAHLLRPYAGNTYFATYVIPQSWYTLITP